jgi:hypothetical protein
VGELFEDVIEEAESARDRIRRRRRHHGRGRRRYGPDGASGERTTWADLAEAEIRHDERAEHVEVPEPGAARSPEAEPRSGGPEASKPKPPPRERPEFAEVVGWQPLVLNHTQDCADCARTIPRGSRAFVGLTERGLSRTTLCRSCLLRR